MPPPEPARADGQTAAVELHPLSRHTWEAAAGLAVSPEQRDFVTENIWTIAETQFYPLVERRVITVAGVVVGLAVYGRDADEGTWWLYRLMIGAQHQRQGQGRAALAAMIAEWRELGVGRVTVGFHRDNAVAERLYLAAGFVPGPDAAWGERTATLTL